MHFHPKTNTFPWLNINPYLSLWGKVGKMLDSTEVQQFLDTQKMITGAAMKSFHFRNLHIHRLKAIQVLLRTIFYFALRIYYRIRWIMMIYDLILVAADTCPKIDPLPAYECSKRRTRKMCWSVGQADVDCPTPNGHGYGLCCFDGCTNSCRYKAKALGKIFLSKWCTFNIH